MEEGRKSVHEWGVERNAEEPDAAARARGVRLDSCTRKKTALESGAFRTSRRRPSVTGVLCEEK